MSFEVDLKAHLQADAAILAIVGDRIHPLVRPQGTRTLPALTYQRVAGVPETTIDGTHGNLTGVRTQIDCWSESYSAVKDLAAAVQARMETAAGTFKSVMKLDQDFYEDDTRLYRVLMDFNCWYRG